MEQRLDSTYLKRGPFEPAAAVALGAAGVGLGTLLAAWGISLIWRYTPPEIAVRVANPEVRLVQPEPLTVKQEKPFVISQSEPLKIDHGELTVKVEQQPGITTNGRSEPNSRTPTGEIIDREVTVFSQVQHGP